MGVYPHKVVGWGDPEEGGELKMFPATPPFCWLCCVRKCATRNLLPLRISILWDESIELD